jgi:enoyl-CoA hydratase/carnithine racemase
MRPASMVKYEVANRIAEIQLYRPDKLNAYTNEMLVDLQDSLNLLDADDEADIGVLYGAGRAFCAGADINQRLTGTAARYGARIGVDVLLSRFDEYKPVIAALHGYVIGGGLELALHCDLRVAGQATKFQIGQVRRAVDGSPQWESMRLQGVGVLADEVALTGRMFSAEEARRAGLISRVVPAGDHLAAARELAKLMLANPQPALRAVARTRRLPLERLEARAKSVSHDRALHTTLDAKEGAESVTGRRRPVYRGR